MDAVLDLPCDAFDDGRPAVAGGALVALVCWPEVGPFSSETITRALPASLPHAWTPLPRATAAGLRDGVHCTYTAAGVAGSRWRGGRARPSWRTRCPCAGTGRRRCETRRRRARFGKPWTLPCRKRRRGRRGGASRPWCWS